MAITSEDYSNAWMVRVGSDLVGREIVDLRAAIELRVRRPGLVHVVVDVSAVRYANSEGLESLLALQTRCEERGGSLSLTQLTPEFRNILQITRLDRRLQASSNLAHALKAVA